MRIDVKITAARAGPGEKQRTRSLELSGRAGYNR